MDAFSRAGVDLAGMDGIETHDCFTASEYLAIDHIGLTAPGESWKAIESGDIAMGRQATDQPQRRSDRRWSSGGCQWCPNASRTRPIR